MHETTTSDRITEPNGFWVEAAAHPDKVALIDPDGATVNYGELCDRVNRLSNYFLEAGLGTGDHLAFLLPACDLVFEIALACTQIGVLHTPINYHSVASEVTYVLVDSGAKAFIADERYAALATSAADTAAIGPGLRLSRGTIEGFSEVRTVTSDQPSHAPLNRSVGHAFLYTSGTTGHPKGIARHGQTEIETVGLAAQGLGAMWGWSEDDVHLLQAPHYHSGPYSFASTTLQLGATVVYLEKWDARTVLEAIAMQRVTTSFMVPTMFAKLLALPDDVRQAADVSSLREDAIVQSAAACPVPVKHAMIEWWGPVFKEVYGGTEGALSIIGSRDWLEHPGSVGRPMPGYDLRIIGDEGLDCETNEIGTIYWSMPGVRFEYFNAPEKTQSLRLGDHITLGDAGYVDQDGWLYIVDRRDDLINFGGTNVYPAEVEAALLRHPAVLDAVVIGVPDEVMGHQVVALVATKEISMQTPQLIDELNAHAREHLAGFKCPKVVEFRDEIPRSAVGKLARRLVREVYIARSISR